MEQESRNIIPNIEHNFYTRQATENFMHAIRVIKMAPPTIGGERITKDKQIAKLLNMQQTNISLMDRGTRSVTVEQLARFCLIFGFNIEWIVLGIGKMRGDIIINERIDALEHRMNDLEMIINSNIAKTQKTTQARKKK